MPTKFNEGKYITMALVNSLQTTAFAVLLAAFVHDMPLPFFVIKFIAVVTSDAGTLCFIFVPKMVLLHTGALSVHEDNYTSSCVGSTQLATCIGSNGSEPSCDMPRTQALPL